MYFIELKNVKLCMRLSEIFLFRRLKINQFTLIKTRKLSQGSIEDTFGKFMLFKLNCLDMGIIKIQSGAASTNPKEKDQCVLGR